MTDSVSGSERDNAAEDGFAKAFDAAIKSIDLSGAEFAPAAMEPEEPIEPVESETDEPAVPATPKGKDEPEAAKAPAQAVEPAPDAPAHWNAAEREAFAALPPEARKLLLERVKHFEADYTRKSTETAEDRRFAQGVRSLITNDHRAQMRRAGLTDEQGIAHLVRLNDLFTRDPPGYVRMVIQHSGLTPQQLFPELAGVEPLAQGQQPAPAATDPNTNQLYEYLQSLGRTVESFERERQQTTLRTVNRAIERFSQEKDADNNPKHPHLARVKDNMAELLTTPRYQAIDDYGERLNAAYEAAVNLDPELRKEVVESEIARRLKAEREAADLAKARKAKAPVRSAPVTTGRVKPSSLEEAVRQSMSDLGVS